MNKYLPETIENVLTHYFPEDNIFEWITTRNPSANAPYHNAVHESYVVEFCHRGAWVEDLNFDEIQSLLLAAAFHDFDHTAGKQPDNVNIDRACIGLESAGLSVKNSIVDAAVDLIKVTQYPFVQIPETPTEKILRDADLMMPYLQPDVAVELFKGLRTELVTAGKVFTDEEYTNGIRNFYHNVTWHTQWAKDKAILFNFNDLVDRLAKSLI